MFSCLKVTIYKVALRVVLLQLLILPIIIGNSNAQSARKPLPQTINLYGKNNVLPTITPDGRHMLYMTDYSRDNKLSLRYTKKVGGRWTKPLVIATVERLEYLDYAFGFGISPDGQTVYFTSKRGRGIGGYDIYVTKKQGNTWSTAVNIGKPVNSTLNDGAPSFSLDGQYMYFMRCTEMTRYKANGCAIYKSKKGSVYWGIPEKLPSIINSGNALHPRITPDGLGLMFASDRKGEGNLDVFYAKKEGDRWQEPVPMDFLNTARDDYGASISASNNKIYFSMLFRGKDQLIASSIPSEFKPETVIKWAGSIKDQNGQPIKGYLQVMDPVSKTKIAATPSKENGDYQLIFPVKQWVDVSVTSLNTQLDFESHLYFSDSLNGPQNIRKDIVLNKIGPNHKIVSPILFKQDSSEINPISEYELKRVLRLFKYNKQYRFRLQVFQESVRRSDVQEEDLPFAEVDTVWIKPEVLNTAEFERTADDNTQIVSDSLKVQVDKVPNNSSLEEEESGEILAPAYELKYTYHNDYTKERANIIAAWFLNQGVPQEKLIIESLGNGYFKKPEITNELSIDNWIVFTFVQQ